MYEERYVEKEGKGRGTKYHISTAYALFKPIDIKEYFKDEIDDRNIKSHFNHALITNVLGQVELFSDEELGKLNHLQSTYEKKVRSLSAAQYQRELERFSIDLSWKSSQIEGNTYSLLETERLLREQKTAEGKTRDEATMLLNHKEALDFIIENPDYLNPVEIRKIEDVHSILI